MNNLIATIAVDNTFFSYDTDYSYNVPVELECDIKLGCKVLVPFGKANKFRAGIVIKIEHAPHNEKYKYIDKLCSKKPVVSEEMVLLAIWLKQRCFCTTYDCLKQMLPRKYDQLKSKSERMVRLINDDESVLSSLTKKQKCVFDLLLDVGCASTNEVCSFCGVGIGVIKNLEKQNLVEIYDREVYRNPYNREYKVKKDEIKLSKKQNDAYLKFKQMLCNNGGNGLLFGVTGSGKTQVYLKLIDDAIDNNKGVIVMVPEISLTPQTLSIFHERYGNNVAIVHSGLSLGERNDEYKRIERNEAKIVIGTRSAIFAPVNNLGLIVMDEEQEHTYKSERTPRYHARDVAIFRAKYNKALFLMASATPSVETYSYALNGKYVLCELDERYGKAQLPDVITVDMKQELKSGNKSPLSNKLKYLIGESLENKKQAILLINRRGYNTFIACNECGHVLTCPNCSISLTYHSNINKLVCHYCGYSKNLDNICPECNSDAVRYSGYGTQRIESELEMLFPNAKILRMDADTTSKKFSHEKLFDAFANHEYDIMVGTQMVAKGLDFPDVSLVGVVNADNSLYDENYMANERSFDLITQVVGRCGRRDEQGTAVIQTINPFNETIEYDSNQDYKSFYQSEIDMRKIMIYPPYCDIYSIIFNGENEGKVALCSKKFFDILVELNGNKYNDIKMVVLGPTPAKISKINNSYRYRLAIKCKNSKNVRNMITEILKSVGKIKDYKDVAISVDLNPYDLM